MKPNLRLIAANILDDVTNGKSLADILPVQLAKLKDPRDRAFVQALSYGVCRYYTRLDAILSLLLKKPMNAKDSDVHALLCVGLYQLMDMRVAEHAAVAETVAAVTSLKKPWARGLVNAVLREYLRQKSQLEQRLQDDEEAYYAHPLWWIQRIKANWPNHWQAILDANNQHPPMSLRVNGPRELYLQKLKDIPAQIIPETSNGISLQEPMSIEQIPGFASGEVCVQDGASQLAAPLLQLAKEQRVLDACAAPGGKFSHIVNSEPELSQVVAIEKDKTRAKLIPRLKNTLILHADAADTKAWWDGKQFDRILLDAPCSASGIIRRHPDIKLLRQESDIKKLAKEQLRILRALWPLLKYGGKLVYATCSIFSEENYQVIKTFLQEQSDAREDKIEAEWGLACEAGRQILPGMHKMDGFYYARLIKLASQSEKD